MSVVKAHCVSVGSSVPEKRLTNADLEKIVDTDDKWIVSRTGIKERRIVEEGVPLSNLAVDAAKECIEKSNIEPADIDGIILATITPDFVMPATANIVQDKIGAVNAFAYDLTNACNGFVAALSTASVFIESGRYKNILVVAGDVMSSILDYTDRNTCILFGDGCGAVLVQAGDDNGHGILDFEMKSDGSHSDLLSVPVSGSAAPLSVNLDRIKNNEHCVYQEGKQVFVHAVRRMTEIVNSVMKKNELELDDIDLLIPHQANIRIIEPIAKRLKLPREKVVINLDKYGNTTAATIPLALADAEKDGRLKKGTRVMIVAFGGGFSWGASYFVWG